MKDEEKKLHQLLKNCPAPVLQTEKETQLNTVLKRALYDTVIVPKKSLALKLWEQAGYISPFTWLFQFLCLFLGGLSVKNQEAIVYLQTISVLIPLIGLIGLPELSKSFFYGMWEMEESCVYSLRQQMFYKLLIFGIVDGAGVLFLMILAGYQGTGPALMILYILVPFNVSNAVYLMLFRMFKRRFHGFSLAVTGIFMVTAVLAVNRYLQPAFVRNESAGLTLLAKWIGMASFLALLLCAWQLIKNMNMEEVGEWNFESTV